MLLKLLASPLLVSISLNIQLVINLDFQLTMPLPPCRAGIFKGQRPTASKSTTSYGFGSQTVPLLLSSLSPGSCASLPSLWAGWLQGTYSLFSSSVNMTFWTWSWDLNNVCLWTGDLNDQICPDSIWKNHYSCRYFSADCVRVPNILEWVGTLSRWPQASWSPIEAWY